MVLLIQFVKFAGVGVAGTAVQYTILVMLVQIQACSPVSASALGFSMGAVTNYMLNYIYTFNSSRGHFAAAPRFMVVAFTGLMINTWLMSTGIDRFHLQYIIAQVVATGVVLFWNFAVNRFWTFRD